MRILRRASWVVILLFVFVLAPHGALAQTGGSKTFPGDITLSGEWYTAWASSPDPYTEYGIPITGVIKSATDEWVLYTQQVRFRETPDKKIVIDPLGSMLYTPGTPANFSFNTPACRVYGDTGFHICYAFLQAYGIHGSMLGVPLSDPEVMNGRIVQAFEYGWLEWRPENPPNQRVTFVDLGQIAYDLWEYKPPEGSPAPWKTEIPAIKMVGFAFVERSVLPAGIDQTLTVIARTPNFQPLENVIVQVALTYPDGHMEGLLAQRTDADGIARFTFAVKELENCQLVQVQANLQLNTVNTQAGTTFRIWH